MHLIASGTFSRRMQTAVAIRTMGNFADQLEGMRRDGKSRACVFSRVGREGGCMRPSDSTVPALESLIPWMTRCIIESPTMQKFCFHMSSLQTICSRQKKA